MAVHELVAVHELPQTGQELWSVHELRKLSRVGGRGLKSGTLKVSVGKRGRRAKIHSCTEHTSWQFEGNSCTDRNTCPANQNINSNSCELATGH